MSKHGCFPLIWSGETDRAQPYSIEEKKRLLYFLHHPRGVLSKWTSAERCASTPAAATCHVCGRPLQKVISICVVIVVGWRWLKSTIMMIACFASFHALVCDNLPAGVTPSSCKLVMCVWCVIHGSALRRGWKVDYLDERKCQKCAALLKPLRQKQGHFTLDG